MVERSGNVGYTIRTLELGSNASGTIVLTAIVIALAVVFS